jgi:hypothetical protein
MALVFALAFTVCVPPALADTGSTATPQASLTTLSPASVKILRSSAAAAPPQAGTSSDTPFLKTRRGAAVLALMAAGVAFTIWSARHDREPVKSPIR